MSEEERLRRRQESNRNAQRRRRERLREQAREEQTEQGEQIEDQNNASPRHDLSVTEMLATIGSGQAKSSDFPPLHKHPNMVECHNDFHRILKEARMENWFHCKFCRERGPNTKKAMPSPRQRVRPHDDEYEQCFKSRIEHGIRKFSAENNMDPIVDLLQQSRIFLRQWFKVLTYPIESALVAKIHTFMAIWMMTNGLPCFRGQVMNMEKNMELVRSIPFTSKSLSEIRLHLKN